MFMFWFSGVVVNSHVGTQSSVHFGDASSGGCPSMRIQNVSFIARASCQQNGDISQIFIRDFGAQVGKTFQQKEFVFKSNINDAYPTDQVVRQKKNCKVRDAKLVE